MDFNQAEKHKPPQNLIPKNTIVPVHMTIRPGGAGPGGWLKRNKDGTCMMLDCEFTVTDGDYARRKFWTMLVVEGETEGQQKASDITRSMIRAMLESARGVKPDDESETAVTARRIDGFADLDNLRFLAVVGVRKQEGYDDKNSLAAIVTPDRKDWRKLEQVAKQASLPVTKSAGQAGTQAPVAANTKKPSWAA